MLLLDLLQMASTSMSIKYFAKASEGEFDLSAMGLRCRARLEKLLSWTDVARCVVEACGLNDFA